jgi:hypothetical protein
MPTEIKNTPINSPLNGSIVTSTWRRYRAGQQQAADQGAKSHGQTGCGGDKRGANHDQQAGRDERFLTTGARHATEQRTQPQAPERDDCHDGNERLHGCEAKAGRACMIVGADCTKHEENRDHGQILKQEDGEAGAAGGRIEPLLVRQHLDDHCRGGHRQGQADDGRAHPAIAKQHRRPGEAPAAENHLKSAETEHQPPHHDQPFERQLQPDHEQQQHDSEMCNRLDRPRLTDANRRKPRKARCEGGEPERADDDAYEHKAEHRTNA